MKLEFGDANLDQQAVTEALSDAIINVAQEELGELSSILEPLQVSADNIQAALVELRKLQDGEIPDYGNRWVALLYSLWYQPRQINTTYRMLKSHIHENQTFKANLYVVDFGCGTLAMQFGVALAFADASECGITVPQVKIHSIDDSREMINVGRKIWELFKGNVHGLSQLTPLSRVCDSIEYVTNALPYDAVWNSSESQCWLSAIHTVYRDNQEQVSRLLRNLVDLFEPDAGFMTYHASRENDALVSQASPFVNNPNQAYRSLNLAPPDGFTGELPKITEWRKCVRDRILAPPQRVRPFASNYLGNSVE